MRPGATALTRTVGAGFERQLAGEREQGRLAYTVGCKAGPRLPRRQVGDVDDGAGALE